MLINIKLRLIQVTVLVLVIHLSMICTTAEAANKDTKSESIAREIVLTVIKKIKKETIVTENGLFELVEATRIYDITDKPVYLNQMTFPVEVEIVFQRQRKRKKPPQALVIIIQEEFKLPVQPD